MGKTKTAHIAGVEESLSGAEKYKLKQQKKADAEAKEKQSVKGVGMKGGQKLVTIAGETLPSETENTTTIVAKKKEKTTSKKLLLAKSKVDKTKLYSLSEAVKLVKETSYTKFDGTVELHGVTKKDEVSVNLDLPHGTGKKKVVEVADEKTIAKLEKGIVDFDVLLSTPEMMPQLVRYARLLGPKGLMPNPKNGTVIKDAKKAGDFSQNSLSVKTEKKAPLIHVAVGKVSMKEKELEENITAIINAVGPKQFVKLSICASMGPSIKLQVS